MSECGDVRSGKSWENYFGRGTEALCAGRSVDRTSCEATIRIGPVALVAALAAMLTGPNKCADVQTVRPWLRKCRHGAVCWLSNGAVLPVSVMLLRDRSIIAV